jgi:sugar phosphate isomerase/epimerase
MRALSIAAVTLRGVPARELVEVAAAAGFDAVGVRLSPWPEQSEGPSAAAVRSIAALSRSLGVPVHDVEQIRLIPDTEPQTYEYLFEGAALLGARYALIYADEPDEDRFLERLRELDELGRPYAVLPVIEPMPFTPLRTPAMASDLLSRAELQRPALLIDTLHFARSGSSGVELEALDATWLPFIHLADAPIPGPDTPEGLRQEATYSRRLPGMGNLPLRDYLARLPQDIPLALEVPGASEGTAVERATAAASVTRRWLAEGGA